MEMMEESGLSIAHTTIMRRVHQYDLELGKGICCHLRQTNDPWRVDETYIKIKGEWMYLYRVVASEGNTIDSYLSKNRNAKLAKSFFKKALADLYISSPCVIKVDKNLASPIAIQELQEEKSMLGTQIRQQKYLNHIIDQDPLFIKKQVRSMLEFKPF